MGFFKKLFESKPLTLRELIELNAEDGMYKGEILNELKNKVLFIALPQEPTGPIDFSDPTQQYLIINVPQNHGFVLPAFMDQASLKQRNEKGVAHMVDFKSLTIILEGPYCLGLLLCCGHYEVLLKRTELARVAPSIKIS